jgi:hypothetical protein
MLVINRRADHPIFSHLLVEAAALGNAAASRRGNGWGSVFATSELLGAKKQRRN